MVNAANEFGEKAGKHFSERFVGRLSNIREVRIWVVEWALLVLVVFLLAITQNTWYGESFETEAFVQGGEYSEATLGNVNSMNPLYATTSSERTLAKLLFANLVSPDSTGHLKNELAESVVANKDMQTWTVKLKEGLVWSDGQAINADDVIYTIDLISDTTAKTTISIDFASVKVEKEDELTIKFVLPSPYVDFKDSLEFPIIPKHALEGVSPALVYENDFSTHPIGSGPFVLNAMQTSAGMAGNNLQTIYLSRNDRYFKKDTRLDKFTLKTYGSTAHIAEAIKNADVMATAELSMSESESLPGTIGRRNTLINGGVYAFLNTASNKLSNAKVRQAIQRGIDMSKVREGIDETQVLDYPFLPRQEEVELPKLADYNADEAKQKREELSRVAERFGKGLEELGFGVSVNVYDETQAGADFFSTVVRPRDYDILFYEVDLGVSADPFVYYSSTQAGDAGWNFSNYSDELAEDALVVARTAADVKLRKTKYESFLKLWVQNVPAIGIYQSTMTYNYMPNTLIYSEDSELTDALDRFSEVQNWASRKAHVNMTP